MQASLGRTQRHLSPPSPLLLIVLMCCHGIVHSRSTSQLCRRAPALTAATYRYFIRGQSSKAAAKDSVIAAERKVGG